MVITLLYAVINNFASKDNTGGTNDYSYTYSQYTFTFLVSSTLLDPTLDPHRILQDYMIIISSLIYNHFINASVLSEYLSLCPLLFRYYSLITNGPMFLEFSLQLRQ